MNDLFAPLYELITGQGADLSQLAYNNGTYVPVGIIMLLISVIGMALYYYAINHPKFNRWYHWFFAVVVLCLINFGIAWAMADGLIYKEHGDTDGYLTEIVTFSIANAVWTFVFSFIFSLCMKWKSSCCKRTPF